MAARLIVLYILTFTLLVQGQSIFEEETASNSILQNEYYSLNGSILGFGQYVNSHSDFSPYYYGSGSLQLRTLQTSWSNFYTNLRFTYGSNSGNYFFLPDLREAYIDLYLGNFDLRLGKQIVSWGKADGINPTDNLTPMDYTFRSTDIDDSRMGNYVAKIKYHLSDQVGLEAHWIPFYRASVLPLEVVPLPENVIYKGEGNIPGGLAGSSSYAMKFFYEGNRWDGSISYYNGLETDAGFALAGIDYTSIYMPEISFKTETFRKQVIGGDFSTSIGSYGLRAEAAYTHTGNEYVEKSWISNPALDLVLGIDFSIGGVTFIAEYSTKYVFDFQPLTVPADPRLQLNYDLEYYNRLFSRQTHELSHTVMVRPSYAFLYNTILAEVATQYNFTTGELAVMPKLTYRLNDSIAFNLGANIYAGGNNTLYNLIGDSYSGPFLGVRFSF